VNICSLASLTQFALHILLYISTVKRSRQLMCSGSSVRLAGSCVKAMKVSVTSGKLGYAFQAVFFPMPNIADVTSHPVYAWKKSSVWQR
jgi:hypothetical protein